MLPGRRITLQKGMSKVALVPITLNATQASLLGFLHEGPKTGWDLLDEVSRGLRKFWNVTSSHVYRELKALEELGLIAAAGKPGPRDRQPFKITRTGRRAFAQWLHQEPAHEQIRVPLLVTLWFGQHLDDDVLAGFVVTHRAEHERRLADYRALIDATVECDQHLRSVVEFGIAYEEAFLGWLGALPYSR